VTKRKDVNPFTGDTLAGREESAGQLTLAGFLLLVRGVRA